MDQAHVKQLQAQTFEKAGAIRREGERAATSWYVAQPVAA